MMTKTKSTTPRSEDAICWIETFCLYPNGPKEGRLVHLSPMQRETLRRLYDDPEPLHEGLAGDLAAYVALLHVCGPEAAKRRAIPSPLDVDGWTVWRATSPELKAVLQREGETVKCPELGTRWPAAA